jgi:hypothetical protein
LFNKTQNTSSTPLLFSLLSYSYFLLFSHCLILIFRILFPFLFFSFGYFLVKTPADEILALESFVIVYRPLADVNFYVIGGMEDNETMLDDVLNGFTEALSRIVKYVSLPPSCTLFTHSLRALFAHCLHTLSPCTIFAHYLRTILVHSLRTLSSSYTLFFVHSLLRTLSSSCTLFFVHSSRNLFMHSLCTHLLAPLLRLSCTFFAPLLRLLCAS